MASSEEEKEHVLRTRSSRRRTRTSSHGSFTTSCDENDADPGEQQVEDVTIQFFYKPRSLTLLFFLLSLMLYFAFARDTEVDQHNNFWHGCLGVTFFFLVICLFVCPNGPFVRPHPAVWRLVLGVSIIYTMVLVFALFQSYKDLITIFQFLDPNLKNAKPDTEVYAEDCSFSVLWSRMDVFVVAHFLGWTVKALMLRHAGLLWLLSITWEFTEIAFSHLLANFKECWWDSLILDVIICNGLGIHFGLFICKKLEMRQYHWESIKDIMGASKKFRRAVLQFTPVSWTEVRWFDPKCVKMRYTSLCALCIMWQISELNTFFLKHIFVIPTAHWLNVARVVLISLIVMPTLRQFYLYVTDTRCKRMGTQCFIFILITLLEAILCIRHAVDLFSHTEFIQIAWWIIFQICCCFCLIYFLLVWKSRSTNGKHDSHDSARKRTTSSLRFKEDNVAYDGDADGEEFTDRSTTSRQIVDRTTTSRRRPLHRAAKNN